MNNYRDSFEAGVMLLAYIGLMNTSLKYKDTETRDYKQHNEELNSLLLQHNEEVKLTQETYMQNMIVDMVLLLLLSLLPLLLLLLLQLLLLGKAFPTA